MIKVDELLCWVMASDKQAEMYLYLVREDGFGDLPEALRQRFGKPRSVMELKLHAGRRLARADVREVMDNLRGQGFFLQMPPRIEAELNEWEA